MKVQLFIPCFVDQLYPALGWHTVKLLEKAGCNVRYNPNQTCCGQPAYNAGFIKEARDVGEKFVRDFSGEEYIVAPSGSCTGYIRSCFDELFEDAAFSHESKAVTRRVFELSEFLVDVLHITDFGASYPTVATYHDACGALRECGIHDQPRTLLAQVKGLELKEMNERETCCGFGGTFSVKYEPISIGMSQTKVQSAIQTGASVIISSDVSCLMHLDGYIKHQRLSIRTAHLAEILGSGW